MSEALLNEVRLLKQRVDVMQKEMQQVLGLVNGDVNKFYEAIMKAITSIDVRVEALESPPVRLDDSGKEL